MANLKKAEIMLSAEETAAIDNYLSGEELLTEDETITYTAMFDDGRMMDIKVCGCSVEEGGAWTEAVLFDSNGTELCCTDCSQEIGGEWELEYDGLTYHVDVTCDCSSLTLAADRIEWKIDGMGELTVYGNTYTIRKLNQKIIGTESLEDVLLNDGSYTSDEARYIDEAICYYVPDDVIVAPEAEIKQFLRKNEMSEEDKLVYAAIDIESTDYEKIEELSNHLEMNGYRGNVYGNILRNEYTLFIDPEEYDYVLTILNDRGLEYSPRTL